MNLIICCSTGRADNNIDSAIVFLIPCIHPANTTTTMFMQEDRYIVLLAGDHASFQQEEVPTPRSLEEPPALVAPKIAHRSSISSAGSWSLSLMGILQCAKHHDWMNCQQGMMHGTQLEAG